MFANKIKSQMRLGQLSKQVKTKPQNIVDFVKKIFDVEIKNHPNVKIQDEWENDIVAEFAKAVEVKEATEEVAKPIKVEAKESKPEALEIKSEDKVEEPKIATEIAVGEEVPAEVIKKAELVKREKVVLEGIKVVNKIDLEPKKLVVEVVETTTESAVTEDGNIVVQTEEVKTEPVVPELPKETAEERRARLHKKKLEHEEKRVRQELEEKKREEARLEKERKRKEERRKRKVEKQKKEHYLSKTTAKQKAAPKIKKRKVKKVEPTHVTIGEALDEKGKYFNQQNQYSDIWIIRLFQKIFS